MLALWAEDGEAGNALEHAGSADNEGGERQFRLQSVQVSAMITVWFGDDCVRRAQVESFAAEPRERLDVSQMQMSPILSVRCSDD